MTNRKFPLLDVICGAFILLFTYAAASKLLDYEKFEIQLSQSPVLTLFARPISWLVPAIELIIAVMLAIPRFQLAGLYASYCLMIMFTTYIIAITKFSSFIPCSCGGVLQKLTWNDHLIFNIGFIFLSIVGIVINTRKLSSV